MEDVGAKEGEGGEICSKHIWGEGVQADLEHDVASRTIGGAYWPMQTLNMVSQGTTHESTSPPIFLWEIVRD